MNSKNLIQLISLAAIWGGSFIFMRILAPVLGPILTAELRVMIAGIALIIYFYFSQFDPQWRLYWKQYLIIGTVNSAIPFSLYAYAALHLNASVEVILNSTSPLFGALFSAIWLSEKLSLSRIIGLVIGTSGVALITQVSGPTLNSHISFSIMACLLAAACYGITGIYIKKYAKGAKPQAIAGCSQVFAGLILLPFIPFFPPTGEINLSIVMNVLGLALLCSAVAYLLYYRLIADLGPTKALTVTFLMPIFGMIWGAVFLDEVITSNMILGCGLILIGTILVLEIVRFKKTA